MDSAACIAVAGSAETVVSLRTLLAQVAVELQTGARQLQRIEHAIGEVVAVVPALRSQEIRDFQDIDAVRQTMQALGLVLQEVAGRLAPDVSMNVAGILDNLTLSAVAERLGLAGSAAGPSDAGAAGDLEMF
ncbi:MAG: hypothetical protein KDK89_17615 [Alphaproteobacteria bacterium]|nr:hypothetical protein [Alphaproteobacteria bacterium]